MAASASDNIVDGWRAVGPFLQRSPGAEVLVVGGFGPGSIGLYAVATAVAEGASRAVYLDADARRNGIAAIQGAHVVAAEPWPRRLGPFPITVDACGTLEALLLAIRSTAPDGNCTSTAIYFDNRGELLLLEMYEEVITFKTGRTRPRPHIPRVLSLLESGSLAADAVTTRKVDRADRRLPSSSATGSSWSSSAPPSSRTEPHMAIIRADFASSGRQVRSPAAVPSGPWESVCAF
ncbi:MAG: hypothetical protein M3022_13650 [Actinomycetota bacterium]|nr:hypothetical protein [Actinomycetota bacterium]